jgi:ribose transport system ATP-binding protein
MPEALIRTDKLRKDFSAVTVLKGISIEILAGETLGLIGENGAGKSTLMKLLSGLYQPTAGTLFVAGEPVRFRGPADAKAAGVSIVPQEFNLCPDLTVAENVYLGDELRGAGGLLDRKAMRARTRELLAGLSAAIDPDARIAELSAAQKQLVEICKALESNVHGADGAHGAHGARLLILDEPTTVLTRVEVDSLFRVMRDLRARGIALVFISHKLGEVAEICDRVAVLRDGELVHVGPAAGMSQEEMAQRMVGRKLSEVYPALAAPAAEAPELFQVEGLTSPGAFSDVSFTVRAGEILGLAGLVGSGRTEIAEAVMGLRRATGRISVAGRSLRSHRPADAVAAGLGYLSEDRQGSGVMVPFSIAENITLASLPDYSRGLAGWVDRRREQARAAHWKELFRIKAGSLDQRLDELSGGNQQKVSLAKCLDTGPRVLIVDEPTRGVDVGAKHEIYRLIADLAAEGIAIIFISSELEEVIGMCRRVLVMREGRCAGCVEGAAINEESIMFLATGVREGA